MRTLFITALSLALTAGPAPAAADSAAEHETGILEVAEVSPAGVSFLSLGNTDIVGLHSRIRVSIKLDEDGLGERIEKIDAGLGRGEGFEGLQRVVTRLEQGLGALLAAVDEAIALPERPVPNLLERVDQGLNPTGRPVPPGTLLDLTLREAEEAVNRPRRAGRSYALEVRAQLRPAASSGLLGALPWPHRREPGWLTLTPDADEAPAAWVTKPELEPARRALREQLEALAGVDGQPRWEGTVQRLERAIAEARTPQRRQALVALRADLARILARFRPLAAVASASAQGQEEVSEAGYIPEIATLDLENLPGRAPGQRLVIQLVLTEGGEDVALLDERALTLYKIGLYSDIKLGGTVITSPAGGPPFAYSPSLTVAAKWGYRTGFTAPNWSFFGDQTRLRAVMNGGAYVWNDIWDPGLCLNLAFPRLATGGGAAPGLGLGVSVFKEFVQVGRGYDFGAGDFYWYGALSLPWSVRDGLGI